MQLLGFVVLITLFFAGLAVKNNNTEQAALSKSEISAVSGNLSIYRNIVLDYARNNSTVSGVIPDAALSLPSWFRRINGINNYVSNGKGFVYYTGSLGSLGYQALKDNRNSIRVGFKRNGFLFNPLTGGTTIALPAAIPEGSVVLSDG